MKVFLFFFSVVCVYSPGVYGQHGQSGLRGHPARAGESPVSGSTANLLSHPAAVEASEFIAPGTGFHLIDAFVVEGSILVDGEEIWPMLPQSYGILLDAGRGVPRDSEQAAELLMRSLRTGHEFTYMQMMKNGNGYTRELRLSMQLRLKDEGVYNGPIDGDFGQTTQGALSAFYNKDKK